MKMLFRLSIYLSLVLVLSCSLIESPPVLNKRTNDVIYSLLCNHLVALSEEHPKILVFREDTYIDDMIIKLNTRIYLEKLRSHLNDLKTNTIENFFSVNEQVGQLSTSFASNVNVSHVNFISSIEWESFFTDTTIIDDTGWNRFYNKFHGANGLMNLSKIGYSDDRKQALVAYGNICGRKCGGGGLALFQYKNGKWKLESIVPIWIS